MEVNRERDTILCVWEEWKENQPKETKFSFYFLSLYQYTIQNDIQLPTIRSCLTQLTPPPPHHHHHYIYIFLYSTTSTHAFRAFFMRETIVYSPPPYLLSWHTEHNHCVCDSHPAATVDACCVWFAVKHPFFVFHFENEIDCSLMKKNHAIIN